MQTIVKMGDTPADKADTQLFEGWVVIEGDPRMRTWVMHTDQDGVMSSGIWECTPGTMQVAFSGFEFVAVLQGRMIITPEGGSPIEVGPGDAIAVEKTFRGTWQIVEPVRKYFSAA